MKFPVNRPLSDEGVKFRRRKEDDDKYMTARNGDWLFVPFQCERCWFINMFMQEPEPEWRHKDKKLINLIRRVNLDVFWSREKSTIQNNFSNVKEQLSRWADRYDVYPFPEFQVHSLGDDSLDMKVAISMLEKSLEKGRLDDSYMQFDTCRKIRSTVSNMVSATAQASKRSMSYKSRAGQVFHSYEDPTQSSLMERFCVGMKTRMPIASARNMALLGPVVKRILDAIEYEMYGFYTTEERKRFLTMVGGYMAVTYSYSLRGNEGFWVDADGLRKNINIGKFATPIPHVLVPVIGFFKTEQGERLHVFAIANSTKSGVKVRTWLERVVKILKEENKTMCPAFCDPKGFMMQSHEVEGVMHPILRELQQTGEVEQYLPPGVEVELFYRCDRSFRRGAATTARNAKIPKETIDFIHRWSNAEKNRGRPANHDMLQHYADGALMRPLQLEFTSSI